MIAYLYNTEIDTVPEDQIPDEWWIERMRIARNELLSWSDWRVVSDAPWDTAVWAEWRQQIRDFPSTWTPGPEANFPDPPEAG